MCIILKYSRTKRIKILENNLIIHNYAFSDAILSCCLFNNEWLLKLPLSGKSDFKFRLPSTAPASAPDPTWMLRGDFVTFDTQ